VQADRGSRVLPRRAAFRFELLDQPSDLRDLTVYEVAMGNDAMPIPASDDGRERRIRELAYQLWQSEGSPEGRVEEYWHRARQRIEAETQSSYPPTQSRSDRT
jgi:hypothetical protein